MCAGELSVAELSEGWTVDLEVRPMQVGTPLEIFYYFCSSPTNEIIFIRQESPPDEYKKIIRRESSPDELKTNYSSGIVPRTNKNKLLVENRPDE